MVLNLRSTSYHAKASKVRAKRIKSFKNCTNNVTHHTKLKYHATRLEDCKRSSKLVSKYVSYVESWSKSDVIRHSSHVIAWVTLATPKCCGAHPHLWPCRSPCPPGDLNCQTLCKAAELLNSLLTKILRAKKPQRLQYGIRLLMKMRLQHPEIREQRDGVWFKLQTTLASQRPGSISACVGRCVRARVLDKPWSVAKASWNKFFVCAVNKDASQGNAFRRNALECSKDGDLFVFGEAGSVTLDGVAVVDGTPHTCCTDKAMLHSMLTIEDSGAQQLDAYLNLGSSFDYLKFSKVYDLRDHGISWDELCMKLKCNMPVQWMGFPPLGGNQVSKRLELILNQFHANRHYSDLGSYRKDIDTNGTLDSNLVRWADYSFCEKELRITALDSCLARSVSESKVDHLGLRQALCDCAAALTQPEASEALQDDAAQATVSLQKRLLDMFVRGIRAWRYKFQFEDEPIRPFLNHACFLIERFETIHKNLDAAGNAKSWKKLQDIIYERMRPKFFKLLREMQLGLHLKIGQVYAIGDLRGACGCNRKKLERLEEFMKDPSTLAPAEDPYAERKTESRKRKLNTKEAAAVWIRWKPQLDKLLKDAGGELPWSRVYKHFMQRFNCGRAMFSNYALATIPPQYLSVATNLVRLPKNCSKVVTLSTLDSGKRLKRTLELAKPEQLVVVYMDSCNNSFNCVVQQSFAQLVFEMENFMTTKMEFYTLAGEVDSKVARKYGIQVVPMLLFFKDSALLHKSEYESMTKLIVDLVRLDSLGSSVDGNNAVGLSF